MMDDPNITMEEYISLEEEKAQKHRKVFNWETAKYGKIWYNEDIYDLRSFEIEFPAIAFNDEVPFEKHFLVNLQDLKTDSKNDNEKVMPSLPSPNSTVSCFEYLNFVNDFKNKFPAIVYNDARMAKSNLSTELILSPQHIDEFDLNGETSLSEYDEEEQNVLNFNDLFSFNVIHLDDLKSKKDNDMAPLPPREQRHPFLRYQGLEYIDADIADFEERLERIYSREIHTVQSSLGRLFDTRGPLVRELILEFLSTLRFREVLLDLDAPEVLKGLIVIAPELPIIDM
nr:hypothetical protein [Tanacetum cinerariifolium]